MAAPLPPTSTNAPTPLPVQPLGGSPSPVVELRPAPEPPAEAPPLGLTLAPTPEATSPVVTVRVLARLSNGERIEVGAHANESAAKAEATALMRFLRESGSDWPFLNGRFVRPEAIVSLDIVSG